MYSLKQSKEFKIEFTNLRTFLNMSCILYIYNEYTYTMYIFVIHLLNRFLDQLYLYILP